MTYEELEEVDWDGEAPIISWNSDCVFKNARDLFDYIQADPWFKLEAYQFCIATETLPPKFDIHEFLEDVLCEGQEIADDYESVEAVVNGFIQNNRPYSWMPSYKRVSIESVMKQLENLKEAR